jgi:hypothetical protein
MDGLGNCGNPFVKNLAASQFPKSATLCLAKSNQTASSGLLTPSEVGRGSTFIVSLAACSE